MKKFSFALAAAVSLFMFFSCSIRQEALVNPDGSGSVHFRFEVQQFFADSVKDLADFGGESENFKDGNFFNLEQTREGLLKQPGLTLESVKTPSPNILEGSFSFKNIQSILGDQNELEQAGVITFSQKGGVSTLKVHLDKKNITQISAFSPALDSPLFEMFGPQEYEETSEQDYYEMIDFAFGEDGSKWLKKSFVELNVTVKGTLISQQGGEKTGRNGVLFKIPLIDILLLNKPLDYSITFK